MTEKRGIQIRLTVSHDTAIELVTEALKGEGFGVLTRIDIDQAFREKLGTDFRPYTILGACNPQLAHAALTANPEIGLLLPCNVTVEAAGQGGSIVRLTDPVTMLQSGDVTPEGSIQSVANDAGDRMRRVSQKLEKSDGSIDE